MKYYIITFVPSGIQINLQTGENLDKIHIAAIDEKTFSNIEEYKKENNIDILSIEPDYIIKMKFDLIEDLKNKQK